MGAHSRRARVVELHATTDDPITYLYLLSQPLPSEINSLKLTIVCRNRGGWHDPHKGQWSWFEVSILRCRDGEALRELNTQGLLEQVYDQIEDFEAEFKEQGWSFVPLPQENHPNSGETSSFTLSRRVLNNPISERWGSHEISIDNFKNLSKAGDRLAVWARAQFDTRENQIKEARIEVVTSDQSQAVPASEPYAAGENESLPLYLYTSAYEPLAAGAWSDLEQAFGELTVPSKLSWTPSAKSRPPPRIKSSDRLASEAALLQCLRKIREGEWTIRDPHNISEGDDGPRSCDCYCEHTIDRHSDVKLRGVHNPCSHYNPINPNERFRLAHIAPDSEHAPLQLVIDQCPGPFQGPHHCIDYFTLSYCWGDLRDVQQITLNHIYRMPDEESGIGGVCIRHNFNVTRNLCRGLRWIRRNFALKNTNPIGWWIDAICINQKNSEERNSQVAHMAEIYSAAKLVLIWLEIDLATSFMVKEGVEMLVHAMNEQFGNNISCYRLTAEQENYLSKIPLPFQDTDLRGPVQHGLQRLFSLPWFRRIWVIQEVYKADANAYVSTGANRPILLSHLWIGYSYCLGSSQLLGHYDKLAVPRTWHGLFLQLVNPGGRISSTSTAESQWNVWVKRNPQGFQQEKQPMSILSLFSKALVFESTEPRDKLFALLGLGLETRDLTKMPPEICPNYDKSTSQVYVDFSRFCISHYRDLGILIVASKTARRIIVGDDAAIVTSTYEFPPTQHPSWALWHAPREHWTNEISYPHHGTISKLRSLALDIALLDCDENFSHLLLGGNYLDEVEKVLPYVFRDHHDKTASAFRTDASPPKLIRCSLHQIWDTILENFQLRERSQDQTRSSPYNTVTELFDDFLLNATCLGYFSNNDNGLDPAPADNAPPHQDDRVMRAFSAYWLLTHPDVPPDFLEPDRKETIHFNPDRLPEEVQEVCHRILRQAGCEDGLSLEHTHDKIFEEQYRSYYRFCSSLRHTLGRCFFISKRGYLGLCPYGTRPGDRLVALHGARLASVLRRDEDRVIDHSAEGKGWTFVGEAHVHEWLDGPFVEEMVGEEGTDREAYVLV